MLSGYFPGLVEELASYGVKVFDFAASMNWYCYGGFRKSFPIGIPSVTVSRPLLEHVIRERVLALYNVQLVDHTTAQHLLTTVDQKKIIGVMTEDRRTKQRESHLAGLVIDTTGRGSRTPR